MCARLLPSGSLSEGAGSNRETAPAVAEAALGRRDVARRTPMAALAVRALGRGWRFLVAQSLVEPDAAHRSAQHRRAARAGHQHPLSVAIPRRPDRRARAEPAGAGRDHRRRDRGLGDGRDRHASRSIPTSCSSCRPARATARSTRRCPALEFPINPERVAPLLRRLVPPTRTQARIYDREGALLLDTRNLYGRGDVLRFDLDPGRRPAEPHGARLDRDQELVRPRQPAALSRSRSGERQGLSGSRAGACSG